MNQTTIQAAGASTVDVSITCDNCQTVFSTGPITVPDANDMSDTINGSSQSEDSEHSICPGCEKEYTVSVSANYGGDIDIDIEELEGSAQVSVTPVFRNRDF